MRKTVGRALGVKASGGVKGIEDARAMPFNGYGEQVASLYEGMDLTKYY